MAPPHGELPGAESEVPVADRVAAHLETMPPRTVLAIRLALRALDRLSFPRRLSRSSPESRSRTLRRLSRSRWRPARDLLLLAKALVVVNYAGDERVREAVGFEARCAVANDGRLGRGASSEAAPSAGGAEADALGELSPPDGGEDCDVAIVGSGAGGAVAAAVLAEAGLDVLVLEAGPHLTRASYPSDPVTALSALYRDGGLTVATGRPAVPVPVGRAVGGTTVINSGTCFRAPERVLRGWRRELGIEWADDLEAEYSAAEEALAVRQLELERIGRNGQLVAEGAVALGASGAPISRNAGRCVQCSSCPVGCRLDAKRAMHLTYLPRAVRAGARLRSGVEALRVRLERGRAVGLDCAVAAPAAQSECRPFTVRAREAVIVAGGAFGTPELLLRSGVRHRQLGRNLRVHPAAWVGARFEEEVRGWDGVMQSYYVDQWEDRGLMLEATFTPLAFGAAWLPGIGHDHQERMLAYDRVGSNGVHLSDSSSGRVRIAADGALRITYRLNASDARRLAFGIARAAEIWFAAGAREVYPQISGSPVLEPGQLAAFESRPPRAADLRLEAFHPMGTARIGPGPDRGVTDSDGAVHGHAGLYVIDGSLLPSSLGVNPMMTIVACGSRLARGLAERLA